MQGIPKQLLALIRELLPKQRSTGDGATQIGKVDGDMTVVHFTQHVTSQPAQLGKDEANVTVSAVLHLLEQLDAYGKRYVVLNFSQAQFGTTLVKNLDSQALHRVHNYAKGVLTKSRELAQAARDGAAVQDLEETKRRSQRHR